MPWGKKKKYSVNEVRNMFKKLLPSSGMIKKARKQIQDFGQYHAYNNKNNFEECLKFISRSYTKDIKEYYINFASSDDERRIDYEGQYIVEKKNYKGKTSFYFEKIYPLTFEKKTSIFYAVYDEDGEFQYAVKDSGNGDVIGLYNDNGVYRITDNQNGALTKKENENDKLCLYFSHYDEKGQKNNRDSFRTGCKKQYDCCIDVNLTDIRDTTNEGNRYNEICNSTIEKSFKNEKKIRNNKENFEEIDVFIDDHGCEVKNKSGDVTDHYCSKARIGEIVDTISNTIDETPNLKKINLNVLCCFGATKGVDNIELENCIKEKLSSKLKERGISLCLTKADEKDELYTSYSEVKIPSKHIDFSNVKINTNRRMLCKEFNTQENKWDDAEIEDAGISESNLYDVTASNKGEKIENSCQTNVDKYYSPVSNNRDRSNNNDYVEHQDYNRIGDNNKQTVLNNLNDDNQSNIKDNDTNENNKDNNKSSKNKIGMNSKQKACIVVIAILIITIASVALIFANHSQDNTKKNTLLNR